MANPSMKARAMRRRFGGRITNTHFAHAEFTGRPPVLIPETTADVGRALALARAAERTVYVRSGDRVTRADVKTDQAAAIVSLEALTTIDIQLQRISVGPAATIGDLATALRHRALFLPLPDQPTESLASAVIQNYRAPFPKSVGDRPLWEGVVKAEIVLTDRAQTGVTETLDADRWRAFRTERNGVVTRLVLDASRWATFGKNRWLRAWMVPYVKDTFGVLCDRLLGGRAPARVDLSLRASTGAFGARLVVVRATGQDRDRSERTRTFVEAALHAAECPVLWSEKVDGAGAALAAWIGTGPGRAARREVHDDQLTESAEWSPEKKAALPAEVDGLLAAGAWVELHRGSLFQRTLVPAFAGLGGALPVPALALAGAVTTLAPTHESGPIPGFTGEVFQRATNDRAYRRAIQQYAVSSFDAATVASRISPHLVAVAADAGDVGRAVSWAVGKGFKVVARSGGHQYCGLSSGGNGTILVDVQRLEDITFAAGTVTVGPGVALQDLTLALRGNGVSIPHGECPLVNLGGHVQTGGVGHQLRSLGLTLDWVRSFSMVGADGLERSYTLPAPGAAKAPQDEVFAAVLGGGPGSWGVLTALTFEVVKDAQYAASRGYTRTYPYNRSGWAAGFDQMRLWSEMEHDGTLPDGVDFFLSVISSEVELLPNLNLRPAVLLVETTALDAAGDAVIQGVVDAVAARVSWINRLTGAALDLATGSANGPTPLSQIVDSGVRSSGALGGMTNGREFDMPYKKSLYLTRDPLPAAFCDLFVDLVDRVNRHPDVKVVFQGVVGGGKFQENGERETTRMQHRDALVQIVFDVFYRDGHADTAQDFQDQMRELWARFFADESGRMFWGTYEDPGTGGAQLDMGRADTQARYYDSAAVYAALQQVKAQVDPNDVFHTSFTVQK